MKSPAGVYAVAYRPVTRRKRPRLESGPSMMPLWFSLDLSVPVRVEDSYCTTCESLRISA